MIALSPPLTQAHDGPQQSRPHDKALTSN